MMHSLCKSKRNVPRRHCVCGSDLVCEWTEGVGYILVFVIYMLVESLSCKKTICSSFPCCFLRHRETERERENKQNAFLINNDLKTNSKLVQQKTFSPLLPWI